MLRRIERISLFKLEINGTVKVFEIIRSSAVNNFSVKRTINRSFEPIVRIRREHLIVHLNQSCKFDEKNTLSRSSEPIVQIQVRYTHGYSN